ncbi:MAG: hypothetical protein IKS19_07110 [Clostridia bacterium]|nr:hypothetical protein [Clostridia bacterium]
MRLNKTNNMIIAGLASLFILGVLFRALSLPMFFGTSSICLTAMCLVWILSVESRAVQSNMRMLLMISGALLMALFMMQAVKYDYTANNAVLERYIVYLYHLPLSAVSLISFFAALCIGKEGDERPLRGWIWLCIPCALLILCCLTNDFHQLVYRVSPGGEITGHGIIYYLTVIWHITLAISTPTAVFVRAQLTFIRKFAWIPLVFIAVAAVFFAAYAVNGGSAVELFGLLRLQFQDMYAFMVIGFWESCMQVGLIPSNSDYGMLFGRSLVNAVITDRQGVIRHTSAHPGPITAEQIRLAGGGTLMIDQNTRLHSKPIYGGRVYWTDDITAINAINEDLNDTGEQLSEENIILRRENELKKEKARYEAQNEMYDRLALELRPQLGEIERLIFEKNTGEQTFRKRLMAVSVLGAFVKRRANLYLITRQHDTVEAADLYLSIKESLDYLSISGAASAVLMDGEEPLDAPVAMLAYDFFEYVLENAMPDVSAVLVNIRFADGLRLAVTLDSPTNLPDGSWNRQEVAQCGGKITVQSDDSVYVTLLFEEGGQAL